MNAQQSLKKIQEISQRLKQVQSSLRKVTQTLKVFKTPQDYQRQDYLAALNEALSPIHRERLGLMEESDNAFVEEIKNDLMRMRMGAQQQFMQGLQEAFGPTIPILSDTPLVVYVHPFSIKVNFENYTTTFIYAHEELGTSSLDGKEIAAKHEEWVTHFRTLRLDSKTFFTMLHKAYSMVLLKENLPARERVDLVDLLPPLSWLWSQDTRTPKGQVPFPRYLLAYQIQKLRKDKMIQCDGLQIDLGVATGGSTRNKRNVLFIPSGPQEGQYYLSIAFN